MKKEKNVRYTNDEIIERAKMEYAQLEYRLQKYNSGEKLYSTFDELVTRRLGIIPKVKGDNFIEGSSHRGLYVRLEKENENHVRIAKDVKVYASILCHDWQSTYIRTLTEDEKSESIQQRQEKVQFIKNYLWSPIACDREIWNMLRYDDVIALYPNLDEQQSFLFAFEMEGINIDKAYKTFKENVDNFKQNGVWMRIETVYNNTNNTASLIGWHSNNSYGNKDNLMTVNLKTKEIIYNDNRAKTDELAQTELKEVLRSQQ